MQKNLSNQANIYKLLEGKKKYQKVEHSRKIYMCTHVHIIDQILLYYCKALFDEFLKLLPTI